MSQRSRNFCFTDFKQRNWATTYLNNKDIIRYLCIGSEICPKTKKKHLQGWIQFFNPKRFGGVKKILGNETHFEPCKGSEFDNDKYCKKDNDFMSWGKFITQGQRTDLEAIKKNIDDGMNRLDVMNSHFETYCRYRNGINDYIKETENKNRSDFRHVDVEYVYGETGTGKTRYGMAHSQFKITGDNLQWFDGYNGEKSILIDEYDNNVPITKLLNFLDGYKLRLAVKGGFTYANWDKVIITSNLKPEELHPNAKNKHREALFRRIKKITQMARGAQGNTKLLSTYKF